jgi:hypothetical protein
VVAVGHRRRFFAAAATVAVAAADLVLWRIGESSAQMQGRDVSSLIEIDFLIY